MALNYYVGCFCLGKDSANKWWPVCITGYSSASKNGVKFQADVMDGFGTQWKTVDPQFLMPDFPDMEGKSKNGIWYPVDVQYNQETKSYSATSYQEGHGAVEWPKVYASNLRRVPFEVGGIHEGKDVNGNWWPICLKEKNADGTWKADVFDGHGKANWQKVYECNIKGSSRTISLESKSSNGKWYPLNLECTTYGGVTIAGVTGVNSWLNGIYRRMTGKMITNHVCYKKDTLLGSVTLSGVTGSNSWLNGVYKILDKKVNGKVCYKKESTDDRYLYLDDQKKWMIGDGKNFKIGKAHGWFQSTYVGQAYPQDNSCFKVYDGSKWVVQEDVEFTTNADRYLFLGKDPNVWMVGKYENFKIGKATGWFQSSHNGKKFPTQNTEFKVYDGTAKQWKVQNGVRVKPWKGDGTYTATCYDINNGYKPVKWNKVFQGNIRRLIESKDSKHEDVVSQKKSTEKDAAAAVREELRKLRRVLENAKSIVSKTSTVLGLPRKVANNAQKLKNMMAAVQKGCSTIGKIPGVGSMVGRVGTIMKAPERAMSGGLTKAKKLADKCDPYKRKCDQIKRKLTTAIRKIKQLEYRLTSGADKIYKIRTRVEAGINGMSQVLRSLSKISSYTQSMRNMMSALTPLSSIFRQVKAGYDNTVGVASSVPVLGWFVKVFESVASLANKAVEAILNGLGVSAVLDRLARAMNPLQPLFDQLGRMTSQVTAPLSKISGMDQAIDELNSM